MSGPHNQLMAEIMQSGDARGVTIAHYTSICVVSIARFAAVYST